MPNKRLRIFAGPNGSGKSTIFKHINNTVGCPYFVNADEIQKDLYQKGLVNFDKYDSNHSKLYMLKIFIQMF